MMATFMEGHGHDYRSDCILFEHYLYNSMFILALPNYEHNLFSNNFNIINVNSMMVESLCNDIICRIILNE